MILRWLARGTAIAIFALFELYFVSDQFSYYGLNRTQTVLLATACVPLLAMPIGWRSELLGGSLNIAGVLAFYSVHFAARGGWPQGSFGLLALPGILYLLSWWHATSRRR